MLILGINGGDKAEQDHDSEPLAYHDAAAAILRDGELVAAAEEERFNRIKHSNCFPVHAVQYCLDAAGADLKDVGAIVIASAKVELERRHVLGRVRNPHERVASGATDSVGVRFDRHFGVDIRSRLRFCHHHHAHGWSAYALSGFEDALVLSADGLGDDSAGMLFEGHGKTLRMLKTYSVADSLGWLYRTVITLLGFGDFDEYKAMGLAPYGDRARYTPLLRSCYTLLPDGDYALKPLETWFSLFRAAGLAPHFRFRDEAFSPVHVDIAAALQGALEEIVLHVLTHWSKASGKRDLCLAGGVAHNCTLNGKILESGLFARMFVQPAAHDGGTALGAALSVAFADDPAAHVRRLSHVYLGPSPGGRKDVQETLERWDAVIACETPADVMVRTAELLANGAVIGWVQGQSELGPRALGNRSILADPRPAANKDRINAMIKKREGFRPFAPAVTAERAHEIFDLPACDADLSFMTYAVRVKEHMRATLGAVTHVDGTARIQVVSRTTNRRFWDLLHAFGEITSLPVLLNTSFNNNAEPIVQSVQDALTCFLTAGLDCLVVGEQLITRRGTVDAPAGVEKLAPVLSLWSRVEAARPGARTGSTAPTFAISRIKGYLPNREMSISPALHRVLCEADGRRSIEELVETCCGAYGVTVAAIVGELLPLWSKRVVILQPASAGFPNRRANRARQLTTAS